MMLLNGCKPLPPLLEMCVKKLFFLPMNSLISGLLSSQVFLEPKASVMPRLDNLQKLNQCVFVMN